MSRRRRLTSTLAVVRNTPFDVLALGALVAILAFGVTRATGSIDWRGDFETGNLSQWTYGVQAKDPSRVTITKDVVRQGRYAARFEVRPGDDNVAGSGSGERSEVLIPDEPTDGTEGHEAYWAWSTYFPSDFDSPGGGWNAFTQFHHDGTTGQANIHFAVNDRTSIGLRVMGGDPNAPLRKDFTLAPLDRGHWYDFVFHVKWSSNPSVGFVEVWVNGAKVVPKTFTPTLYVGQGVYAKQGYYRSAYSGTTVIYHDGMRRGSSYDEVAADFGPEPASSPFAVTQSIESGATLKGTTTWTAIPSGRDASLVRFKVDGVVVASDSSSPFTASLDTTRIDNGQHEFRVDASTSAGESTSAVVAANVSNSAPVEPFTVTQNLADGQTLRDSVTWSATPVGKTASRVEFSIDGRQVGSDSSAPFSVTVDTKTLTNGTYPFTAVATAADGSTASVSARAVIANPEAVPATTPVPTGNVRDGLELSGSFNWVASLPGTDVRRVHFSIDGSRIAVDRRSPYEAQVNTARLTDGRHDFKVDVLARDGRSFTKSAAVIVANRAATPSSPATSSPKLGVTQSVTNGQTLSGPVPWTATPGGRSVARVEFSVDGRLVWTERSAPYVYGSSGRDLDTRALSNGTHTLAVKAFADDGSSASATATVRVSNGDSKSSASPAPEQPRAQAPAPPPAGITVKSSIGDGQTLSGPVPWTATPGGRSVARVEFSVDGRLVWTERSAPYVYGSSGRDLDTRALSNGTHTLAVKAFADDGSSASATATVRVSNGDSKSSASPAPEQPRAQAPAPAPAEPTVRSSIRDGATLSGSVPWTVTVEGMTVASIAFSIDGELRWTELRAPYVFGSSGSYLDTSSLDKGDHVLGLKITSDRGTVKLVEIKVRVR